MKRFSLFSLAGLLLSGLIFLPPAFSQSNTTETLTISTYYPSPYGVYKELRLYPNTSPTTCDSLTEGNMYYNSATDEVMVCKGIGGSYNWQSMSGLWTLSGTNLYPNNTTWKVGIGTTEPKLPLHIKTTIDGWAMALQGPPSAFTAYGLTSDYITGWGIGMWGKSTAAPTTEDFGIGYYNGASWNIPFVIDKSTGRVGIGTTNPQDELHIKETLGSTDTEIRLEYSGSGGGTARQYSLAALSTGSFGILDKNVGQVRMTIDSSGKVGIGTTNPLGKLHIYDLKDPTTMGNVWFGGTSPLYSDMQFDGASDGIFVFTNTGIASGGTTFYSSATGKIPLVMANTGNVGIGTTNPVVKLHVMGNMASQWLGGGPYGDYFFVNQEAGRPVVRITDDGSYYPVLQFGKGSSWMNLEYTGSALQIGGNTGSTVIISQIAVGGAYPGYSATWPYETIGMYPAHNLRINFGSVQKYVFYNNGIAEAAAGGGWTISSDQRFKENVVELTGAMKALKNIHGVRFSWKTKEFPQKGFPEGRQIGFIAQEVEKEFPELVATDPDGYESLDYGKLTPVLLEAIKEQQAEIESLEARIETLEER